MKLCTNIALAKHLETQSEHLIQQIFGNTVHPGHDNSDIRFTVFLDKNFAKTELKLAIKEKNIPRSDSTDFRLFKLTFTILLRMKY